MMAKEKKRDSIEYKTLRQRAEEKSRDVVPDIRDMASDDLQRRVHELRIHQIELEIQNEELRAAQMELAESRDRYSDLYDFAPIGYITVDKGGIILESNLAAARLLGVDRHVLLGVNIGKFIAFEYQDDWYLHRRNTLTSHTKETCEIEMRKADGTPVAVRIESIAVESDAGLQCQTALIDITEWKKAEKLREQLLRREQAARREAEEANEAKDLFLAMVSHELRTPLTSILGWSRLLVDRNIEGPRQVRALEGIERNAKLQAQLIEDLLDVSAMISGNIRLELQPVDLAAIIIAAIDVVRPEADLKRIRIQTQFDVNVGLCSADPKRLQQVVWNLLSNALKFTPDGGRVDVRLERINSDVLFTVSDTGRGISADFLPHVFDPFRQADTSGIRKHGGLGLGLAIVSHIVEMHEGSVHAASAGEGKGATFTVRLPINAARREDGLPATVSEDFSMQIIANRTALDRQPLLEGMRILVVDDEAEILEMLKMALEHRCARVRTSLDAAKALEVFRQWRPDVLISDIAMPDKDGYALIAKVRELEKLLGAHTVAIALTAFVRVEDRARVLEAGFDTFVPKPVEPAELVAALAHARRRVKES